MTYENSSMCLRLDVQTLEAMGDYEAMGYGLC